MRRNIFHVLFFALSFALLNAGQVKASTVLKISFEETCEGAELIFEGRVVSKESRLSSTTGNPFTYFTFEIIDIIKGSYPDNTIELGFMGGPKGDYVMAVSDMRMPEIGERGIYFVENLSVQQVHPLCGWHQGHYLVLSDPASDKKRVVPVQKDSSAMTVAPTVNEFKQAVRDVMEEGQ